MTLPVKKVPSVDIYQMLKLKPNMLNGIIVIKR